MNIAIVSSRYLQGPKNDYGRVISFLSQELVKLGHNITQYTYNSTAVSQFYRSNGMKVKSIGGLNVNRNEASYGLQFEDAEEWAVALWDELEHEDSTEAIICADWYGFNALDTHRRLYGSRIFGVGGILANGRGGYGAFRGPRFKDYREQELCFLREADYMIAFTGCSQREIQKLVQTPVIRLQPRVDMVALHPRTIESGRALISGRICAEKCIELAIKAVADLPWCTLSICGGGLKSKYALYLKQQCADYDCADRVEFHPEHESVDEHSKAEMIICPSVYDAFGFHCLDAWNYAIPVVCHYMGYATMVADKHNGLLFQSVKELQEQMEKMHNNAMLKTQLIETGLRTLGSHYRNPELQSLLDAIHK